MQWGIFICFIALFLYLLKKYINGGVNKHYLPYRENNNILITGCNTGIGLETAKVLAVQGADIYMACRNVQAGEEAKKELIEYSNIDPSRVTVLELDLSSFESIKNCVETLRKRKVKIRYLVNNAGVMMCPFMKTKDGLEMQMGTNHIGHFYFTTLLFENRLILDGGRVINLSSRAHLRGKDIDVNNLFMDEKNYSKTKAYAHSKMANVLFSRELQRRLDMNSFDVQTCSLHPGAVRTELGRHFGGRFYPIVKSVLWPLLCFFLKSPLQGAQTTLHCISAPTIEKGLYYADCEVNSGALPPNPDKVAKALWEKSEEIVGFKCKFLQEN